MAAVGSNQANSKSARPQVVLVQFRRGDKSISLEVIDSIVSKAELELYFGPIDSLEYQKDVPCGAGYDPISKTFKLKSDILVYTVNASKSDYKMRVALTGKQKEEVTRIREKYTGIQKLQQREDDLKKESDMPKIGKGKKGKVKEEAKNKCKNDTKTVKPAVRKLEEKPKMLTFAWVHRNSSSSEYFRQAPPDGGEQLVPFYESQDYSFDEMKTAVIEKFRTPRTKGFFDNAQIEIGPNPAKDLEEFDDILDRNEAGELLEDPLEEGFWNFVSRMEKKAKSRKFKLFLKTTSMPSSMSSYTDPIVFEIS
ncbi:hypothetical protein QAD02_013968 [Eretmocerus hayati]|uniref:Uncharacterized protein n=1 Tax=Eretmocerus hayati TaxID=131215 RepID=A0ACC2P586_9HYME|nr:hypothetical protein QAD02_013968 [Eretmocerus hayati]